MTDYTIRTYRKSDRDGVISLWKACGLLVPWNNPLQDIQRKVEDSPDLFFVVEYRGEIIGSCMAGYDGHRGSVYYLGVKPSHQELGVGAALTAHVEQALSERGCPKINLMVRKSNVGVTAFYRKQSYQEDPVEVLSKRLTADEPHRY